MYPKKKKKEEGKSAKSFYEIGDLSISKWWTIYIWNFVNNAFIEFEIIQTGSMEPRASYAIADASRKV